MTDPTPQELPRGRSAAIVRLLGPFLGLACVILLFSALEPARFLSAHNVSTVAKQTVIVALGAMGMTFIIVSGGIDLSVGSSIALTSVVVAFLLKHGASPALAAVAGILCGGVIGCINGILVTVLRVVPFIVTLGMLGIVRGLAKWVSGEQKISVGPEAGWLHGLMWRTGDQVGDPGVFVAPGVWIMLALAVVMAAVLGRSVLGTYAYAIGSNEAAARLCGIRVGRMKVAVYALGGILTGLAGVMLFSRLTVGDPTVAGLELDIIAAVVIGGASLSGGQGSILGSILGAFVMTFLDSGCVLTGVPTYMQDIIKGGIIIAAVAVDRVRQSRTS